MIEKQPHSTSTFAYAFLSAIILVSAMDKISDRDTSLDRYKQMSKPIVVSSIAYHTGCPCSGTVTLIDGRGQKEVFEPQSRIASAIRSQYIEGDTIHVKIR